MQRDIIVKGRSLGGTSDLTLLAPIKPGFAESLESVTYKTRVKRVLETLHQSRTTSHEFELARLLSDSVERVGAIHSVRVAVLEPEDKVLLAVTFDGSWESYVRVLWDKVGTLLDLIFCGTIDYVTAREHTFDEWLEWARRVQVESGFFYGPPEFTARDVLYHRRIERTRQRGLGSEVNELRAVLPSAEEATDRLAEAGDPVDVDDMPPSATRTRMGYEQFRTSLQAVGALYRLTDLFRPGTADGDVLRFASLYLLREFVGMWNAHFAEGDFADARGTSETGLGRFKRQLDWLLPEKERPIRLGRRPPPFKPMPADVASDVQGGILQAYEGVTHGVLLLLAFDGPPAAAKFLSLMDTQVTVHGASDEGDGGIFRNVAFTLPGLRMCGLEEDEVDLFPEDFRQGMADRAGMLGDVRHNHPRRWQLPKRLVGLGKAADDSIELSSVHAVLQIRCRGPEEAVDDVADANHPLHGEVSEWLAGDVVGIRVLALQPMKRQYSEVEGKKVVVEHFGYADAASDPQMGDDAPEDGRVRLGEALLGHDNAAEAAPAPGTLTGTARLRNAWLKNGSFLVVRKYRQYVTRLEQAVDKAARELAETSGVTNPSQEDLDPFIDEVYAKLMGRYRDGRALVTGEQGNDFTYADDGQGQRCPLHAHIRRANPRKPEAMSRPPRLIRRSMPYGPARDGNEVERGLIFMAYNASISEQFEVVQKWLTGGNSTGSTSGQSCPIVGVSETGFSRNIRFEVGDQQVLNVQLEPAAPAFEEPEALTRLEWGVYLFTPSITALRRLHCKAVAASCEAPASHPAWRVARGRQILERLRLLATSEGESAAELAWKQAVEDPEAIDRQDSAALWAAIREDHGGVLRTPYGVVVGSRDLIHEVLMDRQERYSVSGQMARMRLSIGEVALGKDAGAEYDIAAKPVNDAIMALDKKDVFALARQTVIDKLKAIAKEATAQALDAGDSHYEVSIDMREIADELLAALSESWFGLQDSTRLRRGGADWSWKKGDPPPYPGHFTALSRYMFQPHPGAVPTELGQTYGCALRDAMLLFVQDHRKAGTVPINPQGVEAPIAAAVFRHKDLGANDDFVAQTMVGVLMGFTPTIIGALLNIVREWHRVGEFWNLRSRCLQTTVDTHEQAYALVHDALASAARMRPMPQISWRTVRKPHRLGNSGKSVEMSEGDKIVLGLVSGTQESLADGEPDGRLMFGGVREQDPHPTHACPGYHAGIAGMLGALSAVLTWPGELRPGSSALVLKMRGPVPGRTEEVHQARKALFEQHTEAYVLFTRKIGADLFAAPPGSKGLLLAWGDSWLDYREPFQDSDLTNVLNQLGIKVNEGKNSGDAFCNYKLWPMIQTLAEDVAEGAPGSFLAYVKKKLPLNPRAILLSGGGNDTVEGGLLKLLVPKSAGKPPVDPEALRDHMDSLYGYYEQVVKAIRALLVSQGKPGIPILVHGYDYPLPFSDPIADTFGRRKWLQEPFRTRGYKDPQDDTRVDMSVGTPAMKTIIVAFNAMLKDKLAKTYPYVRYVDLTNTLRPQWHDTSTPGWRDNMHANAAGFEALALKIEAAIDLGPLP